MTSVLNLTRKTETKALIELLKWKDFTREFDDTIELFAPIWRIHDEPDFSDFDVELAAELYLLAGIFLIQYGRAYNRKNWQERGKNAIDKAVDCFHQVRSAEKIFECQMLLSQGYLYEGRYNEFLVWLETVEIYFEKKKTHSIYLQIQVNYSIYKLRLGQSEEARKIIDCIAPLVNLNSDLKVRLLFFNQAGLVYRESGRMDESLDYFSKAFSIAETMSNKHYQALTTNCMANTYRVMGQYEAALIKIAQAFALVPEGSGWLPHFLDTKALIFLDKKEYARALDFVNQAITLFHQGDDMAGLAASLWTETKIYFKLEHKEWASITFAKLYNLAEQHLGEDIASIYAKKYNQKILINPEEGTFDEKVHYYMRQIIEDAMTVCKGKIVESAHYLKIKPATFSKMLLVRFSEIRETFRIERQERSDKRK